MEKTQIANNLRKVNHQLKENTTVVVVTKTRTHQEVEEAIEGGALTIGENRVQEAEKKFNQIKKINKVEKRLIGPLQSNKVKRAIKAFDVIDTVGTVGLAKKISESLDNKLSLKDLRKWKTIEREPLCKIINSYKICGFPPPTSRLCRKPSHAEKTRRLCLPGQLKRVPGGPEDLRPNAQAQG